MLHYCRSAKFGYIRILELEDVPMRTLSRALDEIARDFDALTGFIIDIRDNPGGEDSIAIAIINRFCDRKRVAFRRKTKIGPGKAAFTPVRTWHLHPQGDAQFLQPTVLLTCDSVFPAAARPSRTGDKAAAIRHDRRRSPPTASSRIQPRKDLPNGWEYRTVVPGIPLSRPRLLRRQRRASRYQAAQQEGRHREGRRSVDHARARGVEGRMIVKLAADPRSHFPTGPGSLGERDPRRRGQPRRGRAGHRVDPRCG